MTDSAPPDMLPVGNIRDYAVFFSALIPKQRTSVMPRVLVPLTDTVLLLRGKPVRWLHTGEFGECTEKVSIDKNAIYKVFSGKGMDF